MFVGLRGTDIRSDEAIYSYEVERILDTGDWLTPRSIPNDEPFLEKPPLKPWIVAAAIKSGLLPRDEFGLRAIDVVLGSIAFVYVFLIGVRLAGPVCGAVAVLVLFTLESLVFDHGLRSNNMEGSLFLAYCGGFFHFTKWADANRSSARPHAFAALAFFLLGFLTKFVAVLFLPIVWLAALAGSRDRWTGVTTGRWREWRWPVVMAIAVAAPWFIYESIVFGKAFWNVILGQHVYQRFTSSLDPSHVHAWHYYFTATWRELGRSGVLLLAVAGMLRLSWAAWRGDPWLARAIWIWGVVPLVLMSLGTSKLIHYAYPFWPPVALACGFVFISAIRLVAARWGTFAQPASGTGQRWWTTGAAIRGPVAVVAVAALVIAAWSWLIGPIRWDWGETTLFRNTSVVRPGWIGAVLLVVAAYASTPRRLMAAAVLAFLLPHMGYAETITRVQVIDRPLHASRDCIDGVRATGVPTGGGVLAASGIVLHHSYYYYLGRSGPWVAAPQFNPDETLARLTIDGAQTPVILHLRDYDALAGRRPSTGVVRFDDDILMLLPGPFQSCVAPVLAAGGKPLHPKP